jgi:hypothetical protein
VRRRKWVSWEAVLAAVEEPVRNLLFGEQGPVRDPLLADDVIPSVFEPARRKHSRKVVQVSSYIGDC